MAPALRERRPVKLAASSLGDSNLLWRSTSTSCSRRSCSFRRRESSRSSTAMRFRTGDPKAASQRRSRSRWPTKRDMRNTERKTRVNLYERLPGEVAMIYEMGIPIVELGDDKWHVNVMQKVPLSRDRDNVNPAYLRKIRVGVLNDKFEDLAGCGKSSD